jgi:hypothetical protein
MRISQELTDLQFLILSYRSHKTNQECHITKLIKDEADPLISLLPQCNEKDK